MNLEAKKILDDLAGSIGGIDESEKQKLEARFLQSPSHADGARILFYEFQGRIVYEKLSDFRGNFWRLTDGGYYERVNDILMTISCTLCDVINATLSRLAKTADSKTIKLLYEQAGAALKHAKTYEFLSRVKGLFAEFVSEGALPAAWNAVPQCLPCKDAILDFSGQSMIARQPKAGEFFRDPLPVSAYEVMSAIVAPQFELFMMAVAPDPGVQKTLREILSLAVANRGHRTIGLFTGPGSNGKSMLAQILQRVLPGRIAELASAAISRDISGAKRFAAAELEHRTFAFVEEQSAPLDKEELKRLTGDAPLAVEKKGLDPHEIPQTWAMAILSNGLPSFAPATDAAFVSRLIVVPFETSFYSSEEQRQNFMRLGVPEQRLKPAKDKSQILERIEQERPAILKTLIETWIRIRDTSNGRPSEAPKCVALKESYRSANDKIEEFFLTFFERREGARVSYDEIVQLYRDFFNEKSISARDCIKKLTDRFPYLERTRSSNVLYLKNLAKIDFTKPDNEKEDDAIDPQLGIEGIQNGNFNSAIGKSTKNPIVKLKNDFSIPSIPKSENSSPLENDPAFADAELCYLYLLQLFDERQVNLRNANLDPKTARVEIGAWRLRCASKGIVGERFDAAWALIERQKMAKTDGIYIEPVEVRNE